MTKPSEDRTGQVWHPTYDATLLFVIVGPPEVTKWPSGGRQLLHPIVILHSEVRQARAEVSAESWERNFVRIA